MGCAVNPVSYAVDLDTNGQTRDKVLAVVDALLRQNGSIECGILGHFSVSFGPESKALGHAPTPELARLGVVAVKTEAA